MFGTGVASFGHVHGVHLQNVDTWEQYVEMLDRGELPLGRALPVEPRQRLIREMILQLKTGRLEAAYFQRKFGTNILEAFRDGFEQAGRRRLSDAHRRGRRADAHGTVAGGSPAAGVLRAATSRQSLHLSKKVNRRVTGHREDTEKKRKREQ